MLPRERERTHLREGREQTLYKHDLVYERKRTTRLGKFYSATYHVAHVFCRPGAPPLGSLAQNHVAPWSPLLEEQPHLALPPRSTVLVEPSCRSSKQGAGVDGTQAPAPTPPSNTLSENPECRPCRCDTNMVLPGPNMEAKGLEFVLAQDGAAIGRDRRKPIGCPNLHHHRGDNEFRVA